MKKPIPLKKQLIFAFIPILNYSVWSMWVYNYKKFAQEEFGSWGKSLLASAMAIIPVMFLQIWLWDVFDANETAKKIVNGVIGYILPMAIDLSVIIYQKRNWDKFFPHDN